MARWEKRMATVLDEEKKKHAAVYELNKQLNKAIHGASPICMDTVETAINGVIENTKLLDSKIINYSIEPKYKKSPDDSRLLIKVLIEGDFNGYIEIETSKGYRSTDSGKIDIYYIMMSDCNVFSEKETKVREMYKAYQRYTVENLVDVALEKDIYLKYDDHYANYTLWSKEPTQYGDSIQGDLKVYNEIDEYKRYKGYYDKLNKINQYENIKKYAEEALHGSNESITYEWTEFKL